MRALRPWLWLLPAGCIVVPLFFLPVLFMVRNSFWRDDPVRFIVPDFTFANYITVLGDPYYLKVFGNSIGLAALVALIALVMAYPYAQLITLVSDRMRLILLWVLCLPLYVSIIMRVFGWIIIIGDAGLLNQLLLKAGLIAKPVRILFEFEGMVIGMLYRYFPLMALPLMSSLQKIDPALLRSSVNLGAGRVRTWLCVILPLSIPGMVAGTQLVFAGVLSDYVIPMLMGSTRFPTSAPTIFLEASTNASWAKAGAMGIVLLGIVLLINVVASGLIARAAPWTGRT
ncbi:ABC transporter permease [Microbacteriaceae bacterium K1510]|nr:ABC transporter permease [Microbacteriaceae bacterium K1510]